MTDKGKGKAPLPKISRLMMEGRWDEDDEGSEDDDVDEEREQKRLNQAVGRFARRAQQPLLPLPEHTRAGLAITPRNWPAGFPLPHNSHPGQAGKWHGYILRAQQEASHIIKAAQKGDEEAASRCRDLISQINRDPRLQATEGMDVLYTGWRVPTRDDIVERGRPQGPGRALRYPSNDRVREDEEMNRFLHNDGDQN